MAKAMDCIPFPKDFSLSGSSFGEKLQMKAGTNCSATWHLVTEVRSLEVSNNGGEICLHNAASLLTTEKVCGADLVKKLDDIKIKAQIPSVFEASGHDLLLFSTKDGKKDLSLPYLKITPQANKGLLVEAWENSKPIGKVNVIDTHCSRDPQPALLESYEIRAHQYTALKPSATCKNGGINKADFKEDNNRGTGQKATP